MIGRLWIAVSVLGLVGCSSVTTFENARTMPVGKTRGLLGVSVIQSDQVNAAVAEVDGETEILIPTLDLDIRFGVATHLDLAFRWSTPGNISTRVKYELIPGNVIAFSLGLGIGYLGNLGIVEAMLPLYLSWDMHAQFGIYGMASYRTRFASFDSSSNFLVLGGGFRIGNAIGVMLELSHVTQLGSAFRGLQGGVAFFFGNGPSAKFRVGHEGHEVRWRRGELDDLGEDHRPYSATVLRIGKKAKIAVVAHEKMRSWKRGETLCIFDAATSKPKICGRVVKVTRKASVLRFNRPAKSIAIGDQVRSSDDPAPKLKEEGI